MNYEFTITDSFNRSEEEILKEANVIAQREIVELNLPSPLQLKMVKVAEKNNTKIYSFSLSQENESDLDSESYNYTVGKILSDDIAAAPLD